MSQERHRCPYCGSEYTNRMMEMHMSKCIKKPGTMERIHERILLIAVNGKMPTSRMYTSGRGDLPGYSSIVDQGGSWPEIAETLNLELDKIYPESKIEHLIIEKVGEENDKTYAENKEAMLGDWSFRTKRNRIGPYWDWRIHKYRITDVQTIM